MLIPFQNVLKVGSVSTVVSPVIVYMDCHVTAIRASANVCRDMMGISVTNVST
jgi:hypothetical protein